MTTLYKNNVKLKELLIKHEGFRTRPYSDTVGKLTIGVGRNLTDCGLSKDEVYLLLENDIRKVLVELDFYFPWFGKLSENRQIALMDMCFNLGINRFRKFKNMIMYLVMDDFENASKEMLNSKWAQQVGGRAVELAEMIRNG